jgi:Rad3-related DNA helicase
MSQGRKRQLPQVRAEQLRWARADVETGPAVARVGAREEAALPVLEEVVVERLAEPEAEDLEVWVRLNKRRAVCLDGTHCIEQHCALAGALDGSAQWVSIRAREGAARVAAAERRGPTLEPIRT